ncbi:hypothetical protein KOM24_005243 [Salmonella enterica]|nr:hypothetical protein [Salmonella enterica]EJP4194883.1 hypothetical protein [Salmonella enterica subsp. enterica serovar Schwarzengrund]
MVMVSVAVDALQRDWLGDMALLPFPERFAGTPSESGTDCCCFCWVRRDMRIFSVEVEDDDIELS